MTHHYDLNGDRIEPDDGQEVSDHDLVCRDGWIITGSEDSPTPCKRCRPHVRRELAGGVPVTTGRRRKRRGRRPQGRSK